MIVPIGAAGSSRKAAGCNINPRFLEVLKRTKPLGAFRGIGQNMMAARASGVNPTKYRIINFTLSCAFAGLLGGYYAHFVGILTPAVMDTNHTMEVLTIAYVGGKGSLWGGIIAALLMIPTFEYLKFLMELRLVIYGLILVLVMVFWPGGIAEAVRVIRERRQKRSGASS